MLAAHRGGIQTVLIPYENERDLVDIPKNIKQSLEIRPVRWIDEVLEYALCENPAVQAAPEEAAVEVVAEKVKAPPAAKKGEKKPAGARTHH